MRLDNLAIAFSASQGQPYLIDKPEFCLRNWHKLLSFRLEQANAKQEKPNPIRETLLVPVRAIREKVEVAVEHTNMVKYQVQDKYHDLQDKSECKLKYCQCFVEREIHLLQNISGEQYMLEYFPIIKIYGTTKKLTTLDNNLNKKKTCSPEKFCFNNEVGILREQ